jgi:hypothetical protein
MKAIKVTAAAVALALTATVATAGGPGGTTTTPTLIVPAPVSSGPGAFGAAGAAPIILGVVAAGALAVALSSR